MLKVLKLLKVYNIKTWKQNKLQIFLSMCGVSIAIAIVLAIRLLSINNINYINDNAKAINGGDISVTPITGKANIQQISLLASMEKNGNIDFTKTVLHTTNLSFKNKNSTSVIRFIDKNKFPFYSVTNKKVDYKSLLSEDNSVILSSGLASKLGIKKGDRISIMSQITGESYKYKVTTIVKSDPSADENMNILGFAILNTSVMKNFINESQNQNCTIYIKTGDKAKYDLANKKLNEVFKPDEIKTWTATLKENKKNTKDYEQALNILGLLTFVIGGIGIAFTMLLMVLKRQKDFSILKVLGMKNRNLVTAVVVEATIIGLVANVIGIPLGIVFNSIINYNSGIAGISLASMVVPIVTVVALGMIVSLLFAVIPAAICSRIKPGAVFREQYISKLGKLKMLRPLLFVVFIAGILFSIYYQAVYGIFYVLGFFIAGGLLYLILVFILKCISRFNIIKNKTCILASRNIGRNASRIAISLITLIIGVTTVGAILTLTDNAVPAIKKQMQTESGFNLIVYIPKSKSNSFEKSLKADTDIFSFSKGINVTTNIKSINGKNVEALYEEKLRTVKGASIRNLVIEGNTPSTSAKEPTMKEGRGLKSSDTDNSIVVSFDLAETMGIKINDKIGFLINKKEVIFNVVGVKEKSVINLAQITTSYNTLKGKTNWDSVTYYLNTDDKKSGVVADYLNNKNDNIFVINMDDLLSSLNKMLKSQLSLFTYMSVLCLLSSIFLISNIILMSFIERIKEYMLLKVMGGNDRNIRNITLVESTIIGMVGGLFAAGLCLLLGSLLFKMMGLTYTIQLFTLGKIVLISLIISGISAVLVVSRIKVKNLHLLLRAE